jgi:hypothetical protein
MALKTSSCAPPPPRTFEGWQSWSRRPLQCLPEPRRTDARFAHTQPQTVASPTYSTQSAQSGRPTVRK